MILVATDVQKYSADGCGCGQDTVDSLGVVFLPGFPTPPCKCKGFFSNRIL
jgi:hypothetical protein